MLTTDFVTWNREPIFKSYRSCGHLTGLVGIWIYKPVANDSQFGSDGMQEEWWKAIEELAVQVNSGLDIEDLDELAIKQLLLDKGFEFTCVEQAFEWLDMAAMSGSMLDVFSMLAPCSHSPRILSPLEDASIHRELWLVLNDLKNRGLLDSQAAEKILETVRSADSRDWEEEDIQSFIADIWATAIPNVSHLKRAKHVKSKTTVNRQSYS